MEDLAKNPESEGSHEPWDTAFNRATNAFKNRPLDLPPTSAGRVSGFGLNQKVGEYYDSDAKSKKARRVTGAAKAEVEELRKQVEDLKQVKEQLPSLVASQVTETIKAMIPPNLWEGIQAWNAGGRQGPVHVPACTGSNSSRNIRPASPDLLTPEPNAGSQPLLQLDAPDQPAEGDRAATHDDAPPEQPDIDRPAAALVSTLAELNAITVVTN